MPGRVLIVDDDATNLLILRTLLEKSGYEVVAAVNGADAIEVFEREQPALVLMDVMMPVMNGYEATRRIKATEQGRYTPVAFLTAIPEHDEIQRCIEAGGDDFLTKPYDPLVLNSKLRALMRTRALLQTIRQQNDTLLEHAAAQKQEQEIAERIFDGMVHYGANEHPSVRYLLSSSSIFNGDLLLTAFRSPGELHVLVGDFTGHGLSAAIGAVPVSDVFYSMTSNGFSIGEIAETINRKLKQMLPPNIFFAACLMSVDAVENRLGIWQGGLPEVLIVDGNNRIRATVKSRHMAMGILDERAFRRDVEIVPLAHGDRIYVCTDGVIDSPTSNGGRFGIEGYRGCFGAPVPPNQLFDWVLSAVNELQSEGPNDDLTLLEVTVDEALRAAAPDAVERRDARAAGRWSMELKLGPESLRDFNPVPFLLRAVSEIQGLARHKESLYTILTELFVNALDHGVLRLDSKIKTSPAGFVAYYAERDKRLAALTGGQVDIRLAHTPADHGGGELLIRIADSGPGFDTMALNGALTGTVVPSGRGILLVRSLCRSVEYTRGGASVEAVFAWKP